MLWDKMCVSGKEITLGQKLYVSMNKNAWGQKLCQAKTFCYFKKIFIPKPTPGVLFLSDKTTDAYMPYRASLFNRYTITRSGP